MTVSWESPADSVTGYVIYYQTKGGPVISDMVSGGETETHSLDGLQRGVTYNISILALSQHLPSPLVEPVSIVGESFPSSSSHHVLLSLDPLLVVETSPESLTISPNTQFLLTCTTRAMADGEIVYIPHINMQFSRISISPFGRRVVSTVSSSCYMNLYPKRCIVTTAESDTTSIIVYRCTITQSGVSIFSDTTVTVHAEGIVTV